ncbi:kinase [Vibrio panuliri]|uniref:Kinase n=1 Tax=Vibrio panuliri TaxID=1381081 RepID=A0A1Q9HQ34_9VIBR|nr:ATP-binding protein [Vibrio panuliri]OLQ92946.1 kinase [Vibrio panuliri]
MKPAILYIFSGLPGCGKTTLAQHLAAQNGGVYLRIDTIEQGLRDLCQFKVEGEGYRLSYRIASDNLRLGNHVIADCCNPISLTREEWRQVARDAGAQHIDIEIICSDLREHQTRVEQRQSSIDNLTLPTWQQVVDREYHPWNEPIIRVDTAGQSIQSSCDELIAKLNQ